MSVEYEATVAARRADFQGCGRRLVASRAWLAVRSRSSRSLRGWVTRIQDHLEELVGDDDGESPYRDLLAEMRDSAATDAPC
jgi:hypothetical protein